MGQNTEIVNAFCDCWKDRDVDRILGFFTEDAVYTNIPIDPPNEGLDAIRNAVSAFIGMSEAIEFITHDVAEGESGIVMNERTDRFKIGAKWVELRVMGTFELRDGKICAWRDYFDLAQFQSQMG